jgi:hypothetical protein
MNQATIDRYVSLWQEDQHEAAIAEVLATCWTEDGTYTDPQAGVIRGRQAMIGFVKGFFRQFPNASIAATSRVDSHNGSARFGWSIQRRDGTVVLEGVDFVDFAEDGRIRRIHGFFGPLPERDDA